MSAPPGGSRVGTALVSALFVVAGIVTLVDAAGYSDLDSKVFPRAAAILLIACATLSLAGALVGRRDPDEGFGDGSWWRRALLVGSMLASAALMPLVGFLPASALAFAGGLVAAMHERWSARVALLYAGSGAVVIGAFHALFRHALNVPLP